MECSISSIINDSHYKYICSSLTNVNLDSYRLDSNSSIVVNVTDCELPYVEEDRANDERIQFFHRNYYGILFALSIIDELINRYDKDFLNQRLDRLFKHYSSNSCDIKDIDMLRELLVYSKETYYNECDNYANYRECGSLLHLNIILVHLGRFIDVIRDSLGINEYFSLMININSGMSKLSIETLEEYMTSKYSARLSLNVFCNGIKLGRDMTKVKVVV